MNKRRLHDCGFRTSIVGGLAATLMLLASGTLPAAANSPARVAPSAPAGGVAPAPLIATGVYATQTGSLTRLVFDLSGAVNPRAFVLSDPNRVIIDLPEVSFLIDPAAGRPAALEQAKPAGRGARSSRTPARTAETSPQAPAPIAGVIASFRFGRFAPGKSRVVVDLAEPARVARVGTEGGANGQPFRLVLDLEKTDPQGFAEAAKEGIGFVHAEQAEKAAAAPVSPHDARPVVVIDPGHGGIDTGAHGAAGVQEKAIVFDFARSLSARLTKDGRYRVVMTRDEDIFVSLSDRVRIAREASAALFISIHADALSDAASVSGATVYTVSDRASDAEAARVAENENRADAAGGLDGKEDVAEVSDILFDLTRRETRAYSHLFARTLIGYIKEHARLNKNPQRSAGFRVLKAPDVPSVLLELGYLSSEKDLARLNSTEWREKAAGSVARAVDSFFAGRLLPGGAGRANASADGRGEPDVARVLQ